MEDLLVLKFDAACDNNSKFKFMGVGVAVWVNNERREDLDHCEMVGTNGTSNIGEWMALIAALKLAIAYKKRINSNVRLRVYGDSQLVVYQYTGRYEVKKPHLMDFHKEAKLLGTVLKDNLKRIEWIRRTENTDADKLSKLAIVNYLSANNMK